MLAIKVYGLTEHIDEHFFMTPEFIHQLRNDLSSLCPFRIHFKRVYSLVYLPRLGCIQCLKWVDWEDIILDAVI